MQTVHACTPQATHLTKTTQTTGATKMTQNTETRSAYRARLATQIAELTHHIRNVTPQSTHVTAPWYLDRVREIARLTRKLEASWDETT